MLILVVLGHPLKPISFLKRGRSADAATSVIDSAIHLCLHSHQMSSLTRWRHFSLNTL